LAHYIKHPIESQDRVRVGYMGNTLFK